MMRNSGWRIAFSLSRFHKNKQNISKSFVTILTSLAVIAKAKIYEKFLWIRETLFPHVILLILHFGTKENFEFFMIFELYLSSPFVVIAASINQCKNSLALQNIISSCNLIHCMRKNRREILPFSLPPWTWKVYLQRFWNIFTGHSLLLQRVKFMKTFFRVRALRLGTKTLVSFIESSSFRKNFARARSELDENFLDRMTTFILPFVTVFSDFRRAGLQKKRSLETFYEWGLSCRKKNGCGVK